MFALIYFLIYIIVSLIYLIDLLKINIDPKGFSTFYKREINTTLLSNIVIHPFYLIGQGWIKQMRKVDELLRENFDVDSVVGFYLYVLFKFVLIIWTFLFIYGILQIIVNLGNDDSINVGVARYMTLFMCVFTVVAWFCMTSIVRLFLRKTNTSGEKMTENTMAVYVILLTLGLLTVYYLIIMNIEGGETGLEKLIMFDAIEVFMLKTFYEIVMIHMGMCLFFIVINSIRKTFFKSKTMDEKMNNKKMIVIALCMNFGLFGFIKLKRRF
jgi:hypothetical protein